MSEEKRRASLQRLLQCDMRHPLSAPLQKLFDKEQQRLQSLWEEERKIWAERPGALIVGADEVGRGPLAGPLVAAAAAFEEPLLQVGINDSKKLSHGEREALYEILLKTPIRYAISIISHEEIGRGNLHLLSLQAIENAVRSLHAPPTCCSSTAAILSNATIFPSARWWAATAAAPASPPPASSPR